MFLGTPQSLRKVSQIPDIDIDDCPIERVKSFKCLGVYVDEILTWESHINNISKKVAKGLGVLRRLRSFVVVVSGVQHWAKSRIFRALYVGIR